jgi:hypothetical protein
MPLIHWPNLRFEDQLSGRTTAGGESLRRLTAELAVQCGLAADVGDVVLVEEDGIPGQLPECLQHVRFLTKAEIQRELLRESLRDRWQLQPWGWSRAAAELVKELALSQPLPDPDAIRRVNTREFAAEFDVLMEVPEMATEPDKPGRSDTRPGVPAFSRLCYTDREVQSAIFEFAERDTGRWVIKANVSHAARNRLLGAGRGLTDAQRSWLASRFSRGEPVSVEPWVVRLGECGLQWTIAEQSGGYGLRFEGAAEMLTDAGGQYRGSVICGVEISQGRSCWWQAAVEHGRHVATAAASLGFRGALGIDCMLIELNGRHFLRPCHDINGRQTMGRLSLRLKSRVPDRWYGAWCHISEKSAAKKPDFPGRFDDSEVRSESTSPIQVGGHTCLLQTRLLFSQNRDRVIGEAVRQSGAIFPATCLAGGKLVQDETDR